MTESRYRAGTGRTRIGKASEVLRVPNVKRHTFSGTDSELAFLSLCPSYPACLHLVPALTGCLLFSTDNHRKLYSKGDI